MATILVDYENVNGSKGMKGVEYLTNEDILTIFYSDSCPNIPVEYMNPIIESGCSFMIYKLKRTGKNALDFYIAVEAGRLSAEGHRQIAIISNDKGFEAVYDFFICNDFLKTTRLVIAQDIERGIEKLSDYKDLERRQIIRDRLKTVSLEAEYRKISEKKELKRRILSAFMNTQYSEMTDGIVEFIESSENTTSKMLYTGSLHRFGLKNGVGIYRILREVV